MCERESPLQGIYRRHTFTTVTVVLLDIVAICVGAKYDVTYSLELGNYVMIVTRRVCIFLICIKIVNRSFLLVLEVLGLIPTQDKIIICVISTIICSVSGYNLYAFSMYLEMYISMFLVVSYL